MQTGTVKWFNSAKGYGFITPDTGGDDCFVHVTAIQASGLKQLIEDQRVEFDMQEAEMAAWLLAIYQFWKAAARLQPSNIYLHIAPFCPILGQKERHLAEDRNLYHDNLLLLSRSKKLLKEKGQASLRLA